MTNYTHDDDRSSLMHDVAASGHDYKGKGKEKVRSRRDVFELWNGEEVEEEDEEEEIEDEEGEGEGLVNDHRLEDDSEYEEEEEGDEEEVNTRGFQFWRAAMQSKSLDGHGDEEGRDGEGQGWQDGMYGSMWQNMTGHLETMKDDWAETQADRDSAAEQGDEVDVDSDSRASAMSDTALLDLQVPGTGQWQAPPWEGGGVGGEDAEEEDAKEYNAEQPGEKEDGQEGGDIRDARENAGRSNDSIADLSGPTAATRERKGDVGSGRLEYSVSQSDLPSHGQLGGLPGSISKGDSEAMTIPASAAADEVTAGQPLCAIAPGTSEQVGAGADAANLTMLQVRGEVLVGAAQSPENVPHSDVLEGAAAASAAAVSVPDALVQAQRTGASAVPAAGAAAPTQAGAPYEASMPPRQLDPSLSGQARVQQWVDLLSPDDCEPTESISHWSSLSEVAGAAGGSGNAPPSPPAPPNAGPALKPSSKSMSYSHLHHPSLPSTGEF